MYDVIGIGHGKQCTPYSTFFSITLQTEVIATKTSDFRKQFVFLMSFNSVFNYPISSFYWDRLRTYPSCLINRIVLFDDAAVYPK